ncbi:LIC_10190 family membrane protein [Lusitaniella coriacea]|uniref:LIC_10190 family membrane protein n=1 Tax=Lusitaniella coriacea TaxID=1983105 RepID=UPI003CE6BC9C
MALLIFAWSFLLLISWTIGTSILNVVRADCFERRGDRAILAVWLGIMLLAIALLAVSLIAPLTPFVGSAIALVLVSIALRSRATRVEAISLYQAISQKHLFVFLGIAIFTAFFASQKVAIDDTGLYHFQVIQWLSKHGTVPGLALIHFTFGYPCSWLALAAPFNAGFLEGQAASLTGGFVFLILALQLSICLSHIFENRQKFEDWFFVATASLSFPILLGSGLVASPSPDVPTIGLTILTAWTIVVACNRRKNINNYLIPLVLATAALTVKLSALCLFVTAFLFFILNSRHNLFHCLKGSAIVFLLILPMLGFGFIASGCPVFPVSLICFDFLPWSVGKETARRITQIIHDCSKWMCLPGAPQNVEGLNWLWYWIQFQKQTFFLIICSFTSLLGLFEFASLRQIKGDKFIAILGISGTLFVLYGNPFLRIGLGYFIVIPAFLLALFCHSRSRFRAIAVLVTSGTANSWIGFSHTYFAIFGLTLTLTLIVWFYSSKISNIAFLTFLLVTLLIVPVKLHITQPTTQLFLLLPPQFQPPTPISFVRKQVNDVEYLSPDREPHFFNPCWNAPLPCTPELTHNDIRLRNPERGIQKGFVRNSF